MDFDGQFLSESDPSRIGEFFKNNHAPSDEVDQEVKRLLLRPRKDLELLDAEILDLKNRLSGLESKRNEVQKRISRYELILAPVRRIPVDVLREIFYQCLPTHRNPIMKSSDSPLLLTHVCSPWRAVALSSPRLWERFHATFTDDDSVPDLDSAAELVRNGEIANTGWTNAQSKLEKERTTELLRRRYQAMKEWLLRSGARPLSISVAFTSRWWYDVPYSERPPSVTMETLSLLVTVAPRLKDLELKISPWMYDALEHRITVSEMVALTSLRIKYPAKFSRTMDETATRFPMLFEAPHLRQLSMSAGGFAVWRMRDTTSSACHWSKLTNISCFHPISIAETIFLLSHSLNLVHYLGVISAEYNGEDVPAVHEGHISLLYLQGLSITELYINPQRLGNVYDCIDAPMLHTVDYFNHSFGDFSTDNPAPMPIISLLRKSTGLQKLLIDANDLKTWDIGNLLRAIPSITHLVIGPQGKPRTGPENLHAAHLPYDGSGILRTTELWSYDDLIIGDNPKANDPPLLPRLTSLVISGTTARLSDDTLSRLIKSRMVPNGTAALEHVKVTFYREREKDILEDLTRYAKHIGGVKINLELDYAPALEPQARPMSLEFGLNGPDGRSWPYIDAGEDL